MLDISGTGWGHGVGMCQWGAYFMAKAGYSFAEILAFYYPGSGIMNILTNKIEI
jgi:stage II sporulation protein D